MPVAAPVPWEGSVHETLLWLSDPVATEPRKELVLQMLFPAALLLLLLLSAFCFSCASSSSRPSPQALPKDRVLPGVLEPWEGSVVLALLVAVALVPLALAERRIAVRGKWLRLSVLRPRTNAQVPTAASMYEDAMVAS